MTAGRGAYGLRFEGDLLEGVEGAALVGVADSQPAFTLNWAFGDDKVPATTVDVSSDLLTIAVPLSGRLMVQRDDVAHYESSERPGPDLVVHPLLSSVAAARTAWDGRLALHGGVAIIEDEAWSFVGWQGSGKSTLLAALHERGHEVLSDDVTLVEAGMVWPGPRTIDLRDETALRLRPTVATVKARHESRARVQLPASSPEPMPLTGIVLVEPGERVATDRLTPSERMRSIIPHVSLATYLEPKLLLQLAQVPAFRFRRPLRWGELDASVEALLDQVRRS